MRCLIPQLPKWQDRIDEAGGIATRRIEYELGHPRARKDEDYLSLGHDDVLSLTVALMEHAKFRNLFVARYPILLIDEYQDTNEDFANALKIHFLCGEGGPLIGFFGDHWQKIYGDGCGKMEHDNLVVIDMNANFRSVKAIVEVLNRMRPELPQDVNDPEAVGSVAVYHTNNWRGTRLTGPHFKDDLPADEVHTHLEALKAHLISEGWDFVADKTKILMLTHAGLAKEQGYSGIADVFTGHNDLFTKKEDPYIEFLVDTVEAVCTAYEGKRFGEMFQALGRRTPAIRSTADKIAWASDMNTLLRLRSNENIGAVLDHLKKSGRPRLTEALDGGEREFEKAGHAGGAEESVVEDRIERLRKLRAIPYCEIMALDRFIDGHTPFSTKHGVKGAEFENVLLVIGRGWNKYDFNRMLEYVGSNIPADKQKFFEDNRNLFYVACSRPRKRLALLFTQKLTPAAIATLSNWFGSNTIHAL